MKYFSCHEFSERLAKRVAYCYTTTVNISNANTSTVNTYTVNTSTVDTCFVNTSTVNFWCFSFYFGLGRVNATNRTIGEVVTIPRVWDPHSLNLPLLFSTSQLPWYYFEVESIWTFVTFIYITKSGLRNKIYENPSILLLSFALNFLDFSKTSV